MSEQVNCIGMFYISLIECKVKKLNYKVLFGVILIYNNVKIYFNNMFKTACSPKCENCTNSSGCL
jgi:hypothetical protein